MCIERRNQILIGAATGLVVGIVKAFVFQFDTYDGFIEDLLELGEGTMPWDSAKVTLTCLLSLAGGASLGPESGLGSACCGLSVLYVRFIVNPCCRWAKTKFNNKNSDNNNDDDDESSTSAAPDVAEEEKRRSKLVVLCGMVAAFATILPTPVSAILLCIELPGFDVLVDRHGLQVSIHSLLFTLCLCNVQHHLEGRYDGSPLSGLPKVNVLCLFFISKLFILF